MLRQVAVVSFSGRGVLVSPVDCRVDPDLWGS